METNETNAIISDKQQAREKFEQQCLTRRAALRKIGITSGIALFGLFAVDDLARLAMKRMEENQQTREVGETVAREFKNTGVAFAATPGGTSACQSCVDTKVQCFSDAHGAYVYCLGQAGSDSAKQHTCDASYAGQETGCADSYAHCCADNQCNC